MGRGEEWQGVRECGGTMEGVRVCVAREVG